MQWLLVGVLLLAFAVRSWQLTEMPPGWRDDELINSLVISQKVLDGHWSVYYSDASGHEALYHVLNAGMLGLFGANALGIRLLSVFLGTLTVAFTYRVGRQLSNPTTGVIAAAALAVSFWSLMYSRIGLRHVLTPPLMLAAVSFFWNGWRLRTGDWRPWLREHHSPFPIPHSLLSALFISLGLYTYFASRGVPLIFAAVCAYTAVLMWPRFKQKWLGVVVLFGVTAVLAVPLLLTLQQQPDSEARVAELAVPIVAAQAGDFAPLREHVTITLSMFHSDGDDEWLYNIPHRPVFIGITAVLFWLGVLIVVWDAVQPIAAQFKRKSLTTQAENRALAGGLLFAWWLAGISPGFISVPPASLGHTILAQPAVFILLALPVGRITNRQLPIVNSQRLRSYFQPLTAVLSLAIILLIGSRDFPDYFRDWPERGLVRFLYRADIRDVADYVNKNDLIDFGVTGLLAGPWDKLALSIDLTHPARPRWYDPQRAILLSPSLSFSGYPDVPAAYPDAFQPMGERVGYYDLAKTSLEIASLPAPICFQNGLCAFSAVWDQSAHQLILGWEVQRPLSLPPNPLISNPPPPGVYAGPRLAVFAQLIDDTGAFLSGDDGLWVDPYTLVKGDLFVQQHWLTTPDGQSPDAVMFGLYDPMTGERILTNDGKDHVRITIDD